MPQHPTHPLAGSGSSVRAAAADPRGDGDATALHPVAVHRYRARLKALRSRAPDTLRARIRRELRAAREAVER